MRTQAEVQRLMKRFESMLFAKPTAKLTKLEDLDISLLCKTRNARRAVARPFSEGPLLQFIDPRDNAEIYSDDPRLLRTKTRVAHAVAALGQDVDEDGRVFGNGISGSALNMLHIPGYAMYNATVPLVDNTFRREAEELSNVITQPWHQFLFKSFFRLALSGLEPRSVPVKKGSSSCFPLFTTDNAEKAQKVMEYLDNMAAAGELVFSGDYRTAFELYEVGGAYYVLYRVQSSDKVTEDENGKLHFKDRDVADAEYALSGGQKGKLAPANKRFLNDELGEFSNMFGRGRKRTAFGGPLGVNAPLMVVAVPIRANIYDKYAYSFHHTTREQKRQKLTNAVSIIATDVSDHDMLWPWRIVLPAAIEVFTELGLASWWISLFVISMKLPMYITAAGPDLGHFLLGDLDHPDMAVGLPSGNAFTDLLGTAGMSVIYAMIQIEHTAPHHIKALRTQEATDQWFHAYLQGQLDIAQMSKSDDAFLVWTKSASLQTRALSHQLLEKMKRGERVNDYMKVSYEHGGALLGDILLYDHTKSLDKAYFVGNVLSWLRNTFAHEYEAYSPRRPYPGIAEESTTQVYGACPAYARIRAIVEEIWFEEFGFSFSAMRDYQCTRDKAQLAADLAAMRENGPALTAADITLNDLTVIELEVLSDPSKLQWKFKAEDVRVQLRHLLIPGISAEAVKPYFDSIFLFGTPYL